MAAGAVIAVGNLKGGVGKSTLAVNLGCALAARGLGTVVVDADPQRTASAWAWGLALPCRVRPAPVRERGGVGGWLEGLAEERRRHARVVVDLPAVLSPVLAAALLVADVVLVATSPSPVDLEATRRTVRRAGVAALERPGRPPSVLVVPMLARRGWLGRPAALGRDRLPPGTRISPPIGFDRAFAAGFEDGEWVGDHAPGSRAHRELLAVAARVEAALAAREAAPGLASVVAAPAGEARSPALAVGPT